MGWGWGLGGELEREWPHYTRPGTEKPDNTRNSVAYDFHSGGSRIFRREAQTLKVGVLTYFYRPQTKFGPRQCFYSCVLFCSQGEGSLSGGLPDRDPLDRDLPWTETPPGQTPPVR